jgi:hypothetical protein
MTYRVRYEGESHKGGKDYMDYDTTNLNNVIRFNINTGNYEVKQGTKIQIIDLKNNSATYVVKTLVSLNVPISYLQICENEPMRWFDFTVKNMQYHRDEIKLVFREVGVQRRGPARSPYLPNVYYRLRMEISVKLFHQIMEGTTHHKAYSFGKSLFYERIVPTTKNVIILEKWEMPGTAPMHFLYPNDIDIQSLVHPVPKTLMTFDEVIRYLDHSFGSSDWLARAMDTGDWYRIENVILARNLFLSEERVKVIMSEFIRRYNKPVSLSEKFIREYAKWETRK